MVHKLLIIIFYYIRVDGYYLKHNLYKPCNNNIFHIHMYMSIDINNLRNYRILLEPPSLNSIGNGMALFDLILTFFIAYLIEPYILPKLKISRLAYYLSLIPLGVIIHLIFKKETFLGKQLFNNTINIYKILIIIMIFMLYKELIKKIE